MTSLPDLTRYDAVLFDLDGVITPTAEVHMHAWRSMFEQLFADWQIAPPYTDSDYFDHLDGKKRYDGVAALLRSRNVELAWGHPADPPEHDSLCGVGNRKIGAFLAVPDNEGLAPSTGPTALVAALVSAVFHVSCLSRATYSLSVQLL